VDCFALGMRSAEWHVCPSSLFVFARYEQMFMLAGCEQHEREREREREMEPGLKL